MRKCRDFLKSTAEATRDKVLQDDWDVAQSVETPASIMRRDNPDRYDTHEDAVKQWQANIKEVRGMGMLPMDTTPEEERATFGGRLDLMQDEPSDTAILDAIEAAGMVTVQAAPEAVSEASGAEE